MGYLDYTDEWLRDLTRQRRREAEQARIIAAHDEARPLAGCFTVKQRREATIYFGGSKSVIKFPERPDPAIAKALKRHAKNQRNRIRKAVAVESQQKYRRIYELQGGRCYLCGVAFAGIQFATDDHVVPQAMGGKRVGNILHACFRCNNTKSHRAPFACEVLYLDSINVQLPRVVLRRAGGGYVKVPEYTPLRQREAARLTA